MKSAKLDTDASILGRLKESYDAEAMDADRKRDFLYFYVCRPVSFYLTVPFVQAGLSANQVTVVRIAIVSLALGLFISGSYWAVVLGGLLYLLNWFLDFVDGNIARLRGPTGFGGFIDAVSDGMVKVLLPLAISFGLFIRPDQILASFDYLIETPFILIVGAITAVAGALKLYLWTEFSYRAKEVRARRAAGRGTAENGARNVTSDAVSPKRSLRQIVDYLYLTFVDLVTILIPVFALFDVLSLFVVLKFASMALTLPLDVLRLVRSARRDFDPA